MKKRFVFLLALLLMLLMAAPALAATQLDVNGRNCNISGDTVIRDGFCLAPLGVLAHTLGCTVDLQDDAITVQENQDILKMTIGSTTALLNGAEKQMPQAAQRINGEIYVPVRFVYESFGAVVNWEDAVKTVSVTYPETRNGMTAEEMLTEASRKMTEANRYKMSVDMNTDMDLSNPAGGSDPEKMKMQMDSKLEGWIQADPILLYIKQDATVKPV